MRVLITISPTEDKTQLFFSAGVNQNVLFLAQALNRVVDRVGITSNALEGYGFPKMEIDASDIVIELGLKLSGDERRRVRDRGGKVVSYMAGNAMLMNLETIASGLNYGDTGGEYDACWITPQHWRMNALYAQLTRSTAVVECPHVWDSTLIDNAKMVFKSTHTWKVGVFEPNVNCIKTFHLPLLVLEECERRNNTLLDHVFLFNTKSLVGQPHFDTLTQCLDIRPKLSAEPRFPITDILGTHCNAIVTHGWEIGLNYLYWECLYGGFPLIHNSTMFEAGYRFNSFDTKDGGAVVEEALLNHTHRIRDYQEEANAALYKLSPRNPKLQEQYARLLEAL